MPSPPRNRPGYLASLDGWRALAILGVLWIHEVPLTIRGYSLEQWQRYGSLGVILFFAISGVLICTRILEEEDLSGRFHLKLFYIRRFFRIQPAAWAYLLVVALLMLSGVVYQTWHFWLGGLLLYENFLYHESASNEFVSYFVGHFWTLAVEEHFYLLISAAFLFIRRRRALIFGGLLLLIKLAQMVATHLVHEPELRRTYWQIHMLLWPSLAAILLRRASIRGWAERFLQPWTVFGATALLGFVAEHRSDALLVTFLSYSFTLWVVATMLHPRSWSTRFLEAAPLRYIGRISYSIYLWHVLFYSRIAAIPLHARWLNALSERPWKYIATFAVASASYYWIEKPLVRSGHRLAPPATPGKRELSEFAALDPTTPSIAARSV